MIGTILKKVFGTNNDRLLNSLWPIVQRINSLESSYQEFSDEKLKALTAAFRERLSRGESLDEILPEAFAVVREASRRVLGMRHFDVQLIGGMVLHSGRIAEMKTGEGKTLVATLPAYLNALTGKGVHVVTVNDYLARRDAEWMGRIYSFLGMSTGVVVHGLNHAEKQAAYNADITYGQNNEYGFDYLRDNMVVELSELLQREHHFAIVDEVDSILVDEARTPLIISGPTEGSSDRYLIAEQLVRAMKPEQHYTLDLKEKHVLLSEEGVAFVEQALELENLYDPRFIEVVHRINQALKAHVTFKRDVDYVVRGGQVIIVDEFTGRLMPGRRWSDGLHQAVEAKEGVEIVPESQTVATITFQNFFRMYKKLSGMTGTADTEAVELKKIYNLDVVVVPTNRPMCRVDHADVVFSTESGKFKAVCDEIEKLHQVGQPLLVGTASIAKSEVLSELLTRRKIPHNVLNAKQHEREAEIVAQAGRVGAVTISTNMAGRGTDIILGGNPEFLAAEVAGTKDPADLGFQRHLEEFRRSCLVEREKVVAAGGLHIVGTERHESRRIDNQLRGRAGRQGDPGSSRFYVSLEDDLMKRFGGERIQALMARAGLADDDAIEGALVSSAIRRAQSKVEGLHFNIRKSLLEFDDVMNKQREVIYSLRAKILRAVDIEHEFVEAIPDVIENLIVTRASEKGPVAEWDVAGMAAEYGRQFGIEIDAKPFLQRLENGDRGIAQELFELMRERAFDRYEELKKLFGADVVLGAQRVMYLGAIDYYWRVHLGVMDHLKEGMWLRGHAQKNPLHEYQREAFEVFTAMMFNAKAALLQKIFIPEIQTAEEVRAREERLRQEQHAREAATKTIHENVLDAPAGAAETKAGGGQSGGATGHGESHGNREQRRRQQEQIIHHHSANLTRADYAPGGGQVAPAERARKEAARKRAKAQKEARRRGR